MKYPISVIDLVLTLTHAVPNGLDQTTDAMTLTNIMYWTVTCKKKIKKRNYIVPYS